MSAALARTLLGLAVALLALGGATAQEPSPPSPAQAPPVEQPAPPPAASPAGAPAPTELTLDQLLAPRGYAAVTLRENVYGQLETDALLDGKHALRVGVSTSFSRTIFDRAAIEKLGLLIRPTNVELSTVGQKQRLGAVQLESLTLGETALGVAEIYTADLSAFMTQGTSEPVHGMIGSDFLTKYQAVLEVAGPTLYLRVR